MSKITMKSTKAAMFEEIEKLRAELANTKHQAPSTKHNGTSSLLQAAKNYAQTHKCVVRIEQDKLVAFSSKTKTWSVVS